MVVSSEWNWAHFLEKFQSRIAGSHIYVNVKICMKALAAE